MGNPMGLPTMFHVKHYGAEAMPMCDCLTFHVKHFCNFGVKFCNSIDFVPMSW